MMYRPELLNLLRCAHGEIVMLRQRVEALEPKALAYDNISAILGMVPRGNSQGFSVDVAWRLKTEVEAIIKEREAERGEMADE